MSLPDRVEAAFLSFVQAAAPAALLGYSLVPHKRHDATDDLAPPFVVFNAGGEAKRIGTTQAFRVPLKIFVATGSPADAEGAAHVAAVAAVIEALNVKAAVIAAAAGVRVYDYQLAGQETNVIATGEWETEITLEVIAQL